MAGFGHRRPIADDWQHSTRIVPASSRRCAERLLVAQYRLAMADHVGEPAWRGLIGRLSEASSEFVRVWEEREVFGPENRTKLIMNEKVGLLRLQSTHYWLGPRLGSRVAVYTPADSDCRERLEKLAAAL
jgi:hypothetical protein